MDSLLYINQNSVVTISEGDILYLESTNINNIDVLQTSYTYSSADILAGTTRQVIAAPGAGKYINIIGCTFTYKHGGTDYVGDGTIQIGYGSGFVKETIQMGNILSIYTQSSQEDIHVSAAIASISIVSGITLENEGLYIGVTTPLTVGNGTVKVDILYVITDY